MQPGGAVSALRPFSSTPYPTSPSTSEALSSLAHGERSNDNRNSNRRTLQSTGRVGIQAFPLSPPSFVSRFLSPAVRVGPSDQTGASAARERFRTRHTLPQAMRKVPFALRGEQASPLIHSSFIWFSLADPHLVRLARPCLRNSQLGSSAPLSLPFFPLPSSAYLSSYARPLSLSFTSISSHRLSTFSLHSTCLHRPSSLSPSSAPSSPPSLRLPSTSPDKLPLSAGPTESSRPSFSDASSSKASRAASHNSPRGRPRRPTGIAPRKLAALARRNVRPARFRSSTSTDQI